MAGSVRIKTCDLDLMQEPQVYLIINIIKKIVNHQNFRSLLFLNYLFGAIIFCPNTRDLMTK